MAEIKENFGHGGANMTPQGSQGEPALATVLRDIADDLGAVIPAEAVEVDATDLSTAIALVNELKGIINTLSAVVLKTTKG